MQYVKWQALNSLEFGVFHVSARTSQRPAGFTVDHRKRGRSNNGLLLVTAGSLCFSQEGQPELLAKAGELWLLPEASRYLLRFSGKENSLILVNFTLLSPSGETLLPGDRVQPLQTAVTDPQLLRLFEKLPQSYAEADSVARLRCKELVYRLLTMLFQERQIHRAAQPKYAGIVPGAHLLEQTYLEDLPICRYAEACSISLSSFRALFTEFYGISPLRYRNRLRICHARVLLAETHCTVEEAARSSGFESICYFCRLYKKITGETPGQTRGKSGE